jgi:multidrug efflux pump subunit AcrB
MSFIAIFLKSRTAANVLMIGIVVLGLLAVTRIRRETFPSSELDMLRVTAEYKGAPPDEVENSVLGLIEERCVGIKGFKSVEGTAIEGRAVVNVELVEGTDTLAALMELRDRVSQITGFPPGVEDVVASEVRRRDMVQTLVLYGDAPEGVLKGYAEKLRDGLVTRRIATEVYLEGTRRPEIHIMIPEEKLREYGLTITEVAQRVRQSSLNIPVGEIATAGGRFLLRIKEEKRRPDEFLDIPVAAVPGKSEIPLGNIARVVRGWEEVEMAVSYNGKPAVIVQVDKNERQDTISIARATRGYIGEFGKSLPGGIRVDIFRDQAARIGQRLDILVKNGIYGLILVFLVLWFFTSIRISVWVTWGIPVSFLGTIFAMWIVGHTLNMITMFGLIMVLGILVDDAVVIAENIFARRQRGEGSFDACLKGTTEVFWPVVASSLTTIGAFIPLMFVGGRMGRTMGALPWVIVVALIFSAIEAFFSMPKHLEHAVTILPANGDKKRGIQARISDAFETFVEKRVGPFVSKAIAARYWVLGACIALILATVGMVRGGRILFTFFPTPDTNSIVARAVFPVGNPSEITEAQVKELLRSLQAVESEAGDPNDHDGKLIERTLVRLGETSVHSVQGGHMAQVEVELRDAELRSLTSDQVISIWRRHTRREPGLSSLTFSQLERGVGGRELDIRLVGDRWASLNSAADLITGALAEARGVSNVEKSLRPGKTELRLRLKREGRLMGLTTAILAEQIRGAFQGALAAEFQEGSDEVLVRVLYPPRERSSMDNLYNLTITLPEGGASEKRLPLLEITEIERVREWAEITHLDRERSVRITADIDERVTAAGKVLKNINSVLLRDVPGKYPGVSVRLEGQRATQRETFESLRLGTIVGLLAVMLILILTTDSWSMPFLVLSVVPVALVGAVWGHVVMGYHLTMLGTMAGIGLAGVVVNDAIILLDFYQRKRSNEASTTTALVSAVKSRFRPIIITTVTTVAGLLPVLVETSIQAQFLIPMAITLAFGLIFGTMGTLVLMPALLKIYKDISD